MATIELSEKDSARNSAEPIFLEIPLADIQASPLNPRKAFDEAALDELAASIREHGLLQPIVVRERAQGDGFSIIAGERRFRACQRLGLETITASVVEGVDDRTALQLALVENLQRRDLDPIEEARGYADLNRVCGLKQAEIAERVNRSQPAVANRMRLLELPDDVQAMISDGRLTPAHGLAIARFKDYPVIASKIGALATERKMTVHEMESGVPFSHLIESEGLMTTVSVSRAVEQAECEGCPHRRDGSEFWFLCFNPPCYKAKLAEVEKARQQRGQEQVESVREAKRQLAEGASAPIDVTNLPWDTYEDFTHKSALPAGCPGREGCAKCVEGRRHGYAAIVCTDPKCFKRLARLEEKAKAKALRDDVKAKIDRIPALCQGLALADFGERALVPIIAYALGNVYDADAVNMAFAGVEPKPGCGSPNVRAQQVEELAKLPARTLVRCTLQAILLYEQRTRTQKEPWHNPGTAVSDSYLPAEESAAND